MRSLLLATAGILSLAALAQSAAAADLSRRYEPVPGAPVYAPLYALFLVGPTAMLIEIWLESQRPKMA